MTKIILIVTACAGIVGSSYIQDMQIRSLRKQIETEKNNRTKFENDATEFMRAQVETDKSITHFIQTQSMVDVTIASNILFLKENQTR